MVELTFLRCVDHMSRDCPLPRSNGDGNERRTGRDTLSGLLPGVCLTVWVDECVGGGVTSKDVPLPSWKPVASEPVVAQGWGGAGNDTWA